MSRMSRNFNPDPTISIFKRNFYQCGIQCIGYAIVKIAIVKNCGISCLDGGLWSRNSSVLRWMINERSFDGVVRMSGHRVVIADSAAAAAAAASLVALRPSVSDISRQSIELDRRRHQHVVKKSSLVTIDCPWTSTCVFVNVYRLQRYCITASYEPTRPITDLLTSAR